MSQLNVDSIKDRTGADQPDIVGVAKAFVNFNGTGTVAIRSSYNVSSITDNGTGDYTVNFANAMPDTNYNNVAMASINALGTAADEQASEYTTSRTTAATRIIVRQLGGSSATQTRDSSSCNVAIFR